MAKARTPKIKTVEKISISLPKDLAEWLDSEVGTDWGERSKFVARLIEQAKKSAVSSVIRK